MKLKKQSITDVELSPDVYILNDFVTKHIDDKGGVTEERFFDVIDLETKYVQEAKKRKPLSGQFDIESFMESVSEPESEKGIK